MAKEIKVGPVIVTGIGRHKVRGNLGNPRFWITAADNADDIPDRLTGKLGYTRTWATKTNGQVGYKVSDGLIGKTVNLTLDGRLQIIDIEPV